MKNLFLLLFVTCFLATCKNDPATSKDSPVPAAPITQNQNPSNPSPEPNTTANSTPEAIIPVEASNPSGTIKGSNVTIRKESSVQSEKIGSFENNEKVEVLETKNVNNEGEAILTKPITVKGSGGEVNLPKGKAVVIELYESQYNSYTVTYQDPQKGTLTAEIDARAVETITYSTWYLVKRKNGESGWVLGKFVKIN